MTQEEKQLLLVDLCARLPYGVICYNRSTESNFTLNEATDTDSDRPTFDYGYGELEVVEPYLRSMSSMTEEEQKEFVGFHCVKLCPIVIGEMLTLENETRMFDWLNAHHFDFRGLIEKGLALEALEKMYNTKTK